MDIVILQKWYKENIRLNSPVSTVVFCYVLPVVWYSIWATSMAKMGWGVWSVGLCLITFGSLLLYLCLLHDRSEYVLPLDHKDQEDKVEPITTEVREDFYSSFTDLQQELEESKSYGQGVLRNLSDTEASLREKEQQIKVLQQECACLSEEKKNWEEKELAKEQVCVADKAALNAELVKYKDCLEAKEVYISRLQKQNSDLNYEIKTLLQLGKMDGLSSEEPQKVGAELLHPAMGSFVMSDEATSEAQVATMEMVNQLQGTNYDAWSQLQVCIELAETLETGSHYSQQSRFSDLHESSQALDLRQLADLFRSKISAPVLLVNPVDGIPLFASDQIQGLLGWMPEKVTKDFYSLLQEGLADWQKGLEVAAEEGSATARFILRTRSGEDTMIYAAIGSIGTGVFAGYMVVIFYSPV